MIHSIQKEICAPQTVASALGCNGHRDHMPTANFRNVGPYHVADGPFALLMAAQLPESRALL